MVAPLLIAGARIALGSVARGAAAGALEGELATMGSRLLGSLGGDIGDQALHHMSKFVIEEVNRMAREIYNSAKANTPVKSGNLQNSWQIKLMETAEGVAEVWNEADYAVYVEYDTNKSSGHYMLTNAIAQVTK